jgi:hypothetical protein
MNLKHNTSSEDKLLMASTWFFIKAINGETTIAALLESKKLGADNSDLPPPVGIITKVFCLLSKL